MDEVYIKIDSQEWELPTSNRYVSDSDSPLSLLPSTEITSSSSVTASPIISTANVMMSMMVTPSPYNQSNFNGFEKSTHEDDGEEAEYLSVMYHENIIADNDSIACVRPQSVSIQWPNKPVVIQAEDDDDEIDSASSSEDSDTPTTSINDSIKIVIRNKSNNRKNENEVNSQKEVIILIPPTEEQAISNYKRRKSPSSTYINKKKKRTVTSYDSQTSLYLKSVFFEVYSKQSKLTKEQRNMVKEKTGLPSRNITYWFSNHKRRFQDTLKVYRKVVEDSGGSIKTYDDFIRWRKNCDLPDQVTQDEIIEYQ